jgi:predicted helicase
VYNTGEIDVAFTVKQINGTLFENLGDMLLVECKNWSVKVDKKEITDFIAKLSRVRANVGILFSRGEITTNAKDEIRAEWRQTGRIIIVITSVDLDKIILGENLYDLLERRFYDAKLS